MNALLGLHWHWLVAILGMSIATYVTRISGMVLMQGVVVSGRLKAALDAVPVSVMIAVITPDVLLKGWPEKGAAVIVAACAYFRAPLVLNILVGMFSAVALRWLLA
jgi:uncharacterized membrane protein